MKSRDYLQMIPLLLILIAFVVRPGQVQAQSGPVVRSVYILYNLLFILPLVVVFVLVTYGTGSKQLTRFLQQRAATVKLGLTLLFAALATWLIASVMLA